MTNIKRIFFTVLFTAALAGCTGLKSSEEIRNYNEPRYNADPQIELDVKKVEIISEFTPSFTRPNVEHLFPISIEKTARLWGHDRLKADDYASDKIAEYIIKDASVTEEIEPSGDIFTPDRLKYRATLDVIVRIYDTQSMSKAETEVVAWRELYIPANTDIAEKERYWNGMVIKLFDEFNRKMDKNIRQYLNMYIKNNSYLRECILTLEKMGVLVYVNIETFNLLNTGKKNLDRVGKYAVVVFSRNEFSLRQRMLKRLLDIVGALVGMIPLTIATIIFGPIIKLQAPGPIFFGQRRNGEMGRVFTCYKFRSMVMNPYSDKKQTVRDDPRKTWIGNIIRKTSIDELPQFYNVLRGDMSVVGPRPHMLEHTRIYSELVDKYMLRHLVKPGITGWAQIHGLRGEIQDVDFMRRRVEADVWYIEHWSFFLDLKIIYKTFIGAIFGDKNAI